MELSDQLTQFQERLLDQTEDAQRANAQLETLRRERDHVNVAHAEQVQQLVDERTRLQVYRFLFLLIVTELALLYRSHSHFGDH